MIHLFVAKKIATLHPELIKNLSQFYLGALSPDSVHFRAEFIANDKKTTHLCVSDENWGEVTNNSQWIDCVISFLYEHKDSKNSCFALGYVVHILSDIYNNIHIWTPYRRRTKLQVGKYYGSTYHKEQAIVDFRLACEFNHKKEVWDLLEKSKAVTIQNIVSAEDIEKLRENILRVQYKNNISGTIATELYTYDDALKQIDNTALFVSDILKSPKSASDLINSF